jgi:hypothetical protein
LLLLQVVEAIRGLRTIYAFKGAKLVPLRERPAAISVNKQARAAIARDSWVRVRGGLYKDDLAKVRWCCTGCLAFSASAAAAAAAVAGRCCLPPAGQTWL